MLIGPPDLLPTLKQSIDATHEVIPFPEADALRALEVISRRRPQIVMVEKAFAATPRGAALINRIKADPTLTRSEIRVVGVSAEDSRVVSPAGSSAVAAGAAGAGKAGAPAAPLDQRGTRRAPRHKVASTVQILADGNIATVVDLSTIGAQIISAVILKPNQKLRVILSDEQVSIRFSAVVAWASFEIPQTSSPHYRAGIEFVDADAAAIEAFSLRHRQ